MRSLIFDTGPLSHFARIERLDLADRLIATDYRLPFGPGGFARWATDNDLVPGSRGTYER